MTWHSPGITKRRHPRTALCRALHSQENAGLHDTTSERPIEWADGSKRVSHEALVPGNEARKARPAPRITEDKQRALVEIDALVAVTPGTNTDQLTAAHRTVFSVLYGYDAKRDSYAENGRLVLYLLAKKRLTDGDELTVKN